MEERGINVKKVVPVLAIIIGLYWVIQGCVYGLWVRNGPGGGFLPVIGGLMAIACSLVILWNSRKDKAPSGFTWTAFLPAAALLGMVFFSYLVGLIISIAVYIFLWLILVEKWNPLYSLAISLGTLIAIYCIFVLWLSVPFPKGILGLI